ncbi:fimbrial protein [Serratia sp. NPDC078593]|uniref:fimbrial protein n=1 Tax=unclassified Serratia (in: enterobacteria) TaxID=2647522 RepID=UPI0037D49B5B
MKDLKLNLFKSTLLLVAAASMGVSQFSLADTQLNIKGTIKASPCTVDTPSSSGITVDLGDNIQASTLATPKSGSEWVPVPIRLKDCPPTTSAVMATFAGTPATEETDLYANTTAAGAATLVQIELADSANEARMGNGKSMAQPVSSATNDATFNLKARAYSSAGGATPGDIVGTVQVSFTYE